MGQSTGGVHGFAPALTSFVGRAGAVREVAGLLAEFRLVTVTGPGGSGKTRLAAEVGGRVADRFADGVWQAELAAVRDPAQVPAAVAAALGVREQPEIPVLKALALALSQQQVLLVLDNCEHVIGAVAELCAGLLQSADEVRVLATSREPLRVAGEARYRLAPLTLPDLDDPAGDRSEAVALFADRARRADPRFALDERAGPAVARLVTRLDGMPLAIELAAARVEALGVAQLLDRIDDRFCLLTSGDRLATRRHRSLAATVEWSYQLLGERERQVFRAVSVFPGPFTLEAAEAVAGPGTGPTVLHLVDCSLLVPPRADPDGRSRYAMLETLRAYGAGLRSEGDEDVAAALAGYALRVAEQATAGLQTGTGESAAARWLDAEDAILRQALAWAMRHDAAVALRLAVALAPWWYSRGRTSGYPLLRQAAGNAVPGSDAWCTAQFWLGLMAQWSADLDDALGHFAAVCDIFKDAAPPPLLANCLAGRSIALSNMDRIAEAAEDGLHSLALARELEDQAGEALALTALCAARYYAGDLDGAVPLARQADAIRADIPGWIARLGRVMSTIVLDAADDQVAAERSCAAGLAGARESGDLQSQAPLLTQLAMFDLRARRVEDAAAHLRESLEIAGRTGVVTDVLNSLDCCGYLCAASGRPGDAVTVWTAYAAINRDQGYPDLPTDATRRDEPMREARQVIGEAQVQLAEDRGAAMSLATAAEYALLLATAGSVRPGGPPELARLSPRERELVTLVAQGRTNAEIAAQLFISIRTVGSHLDRIRGKTGCRRRADLTRLALSAGLV